MSRILPIALAAVVFTACANDEVLMPNTQLSSAKADREFTVMTRNIYLGAELGPIFSAPPQLVPVAAAQVWAQIQATDFPRRAGLLADEIASHNPDVVGLQEVVSYYVQSPGDAALGGSVRATAVRYDFLQLLLDSLAARGAHYTAVARNTNSDVELPVYTGASPIPFNDVRFVDSDVILARSGVFTYNPRSANYDAKATVPVAGGSIDQLRGWSSVDVIAGDVGFRFINTHLETQSFAAIQGAQASQLLEIASESPAPVVLVGDLNSAADGSQTTTYSRMRSALFEDTWDTSNSGFTCCNLPDLSNTQPTYDQRLDLVLTRGFSSVKSRTEIVGDKANDRLSGIWPSDHAGVVAHLTISK